MKKIIHLIFCITLSSSAWAQNMNVQSAANSLKENDLAAAKGFIDRALENEQTANNYKMWYYRAKVYFAIDTSKTQKGIDKDAAEKSVIAYLNCIKTDTRGWYTDECKSSVWVAGLELFNAAIEAYNQKDYERAIRYFNRIFDVFPADADKNLKRNNVTQEILWKNLYFCSSKTSQSAKAKEYLQKLMDANYNDPNIYLYMERAYLQDKDTTQALTFLEKGRQKFEDNIDLINEELNIYISQGHTDILLQKLSAAIELNAEHELLYYNRGTIYEKKKEYVKAEEDYKKCIELNDKYFDAYYNLGAMKFNQGAEMANVANSITDNKKYEEAKAKADLKLRESLPYLEKAYELNPKDKSTLQSLKQLYARTGDKEKYEKIKNSLDSMK